MLREARRVSSGAGSVPREEVMGQGEGQEEVTGEGQGGGQWVRGGEISKVT